MFGAIRFVSARLGEVTLFSFGGRLIGFDVVVILVGEFVGEELSGVRAGEVDGIYFIEDFFELERLQGWLIKGEGLVVGGGLEVFINQAFVFV